MITLANMDRQYEARQALLASVQQESMADLKNERARLGANRRRNPSIKTRLAVIEAEIFRRKRR